MTKEEKREYSRKYRQEHKEDAKKYYQEHKEEKREYGKKYYANPEVQKRVAERGKHYREEHREELREASKTRYRKKQKAGTLMFCWVKERYEGIPCIDCDRLFSWECMDFDHRPEETKLFGIGQKGVYIITPERIAEVEKEIAKCDLICSNCHRTRTKERYRS